VTGVAVTSVDASGVSLGERRVPARTVLWAAGVAGSPLARALGVPLDRAGGVRVRRDLTIPEHDDVFVIGDLASIEIDGRPVPGVAPAAMQQGRWVAQAIQSRLAGRTARPFRYVDKGSLATIGRSRAVADIRGLGLTGLVAWLAWLFIHIWYLIGFRNRLLVLLEWAWAWLTFDRGARLITGGPK
jgi:NADH dehydrogenase